MILILMGTMLHTGLMSPGATTTANISLEVSASSQMARSVHRRAVHQSEHKAARHWQLAETVEKTLSVQAVAALATQAWHLPTSQQMLQQRNLLTRG